MLNTLIHKFNKNSFREVVILTAGPSLSNINKKDLNEFCKDKYVVAVKQAINFVDRCDLHVFNDDNFNVTDYSRFIERPFRVYIKSGSLYKRVPKFSYDLFYTIDRSVSVIDKSLASTCDFSRWCDLSKVSRPLGPGIMYEFCIFIPLYFSSKKVHIFGWDIGSPSSNVINRFYESDSLFNKFKYFLQLNFLGIYNSIYIHLENLLRQFIFNFIDNTIRINLPGVRDGEAAFISSSTDSLYDFYTKQSIACLIYSDRSMVSSKFERAFL